MVRCFERKATDARRQVFPKRGFADKPRCAFRLEKPAHRRYTGQDAQRRQVAPRKAAKIREASASAPALPVIRT
ncbi:MAG: hypothetical protein D6741_03965, partial [Planctomycetota bacterium]